MLNTYVELTLDYSGEISIAVEVELKGKIPLTAMPFIITIMPGVNLEIEPSLVVEFEGNVSLSLGKIEGRIGLSIDAEGNVRNLTETPEISSPELELEGSLFFGFSLEPSIDIQIVTIQLAEISLDVVKGVEAEASATYPMNDPDNHPCSLCMEGELAAKLELSAEAELGDSDEDSNDTATTTTAATTTQNSPDTQTTAVSETDEGSPPDSTTTTEASISIEFKKGWGVEVTFTPIKIELGSFYVSSKNGILDAGWGECPNNKH